MTSAADWEVYVEVHVITERRDGCVYRTRPDGFAWVPMDQRWGDGADRIYTPPAEHHNPRRKS